MADEADTLGFGMTYGMVAVRTACGQLVSLSHSNIHDRVPPHKHVNDYLCIVVAGGFAEHAGNSWRERPTGSYFLHRAGETHHDVFGVSGATCLCLHSNAGTPTLQSDGICSRSVRMAVDQLAFELASRSPQDLAVASLAAEITGELQPGGDHGGDRGCWIDDVVEAICDDPERRWSLRELADIARRHPVHVAKAFRRQTGLSLGAFQRRRRLTRLSVALRTRKTPLAELAADFGYCDQAHMNAEFRDAFGISPGRFRSDLH